MIGGVPYTVGIASLPVIQPTPTQGSAALLHHLARRMRLRGETVLATFGLRPRHLVALTVLRGGGSTQQALAATLQIDGTNLVGLLNELEAEKLIERRRSSEDRRRHIVELTSAGAKRLAKAELALATVEDDVLGNLDAEQREMLYSLLLQATSGDEVACTEPADAGAGC
jgi:DNA-binding MarR family transcriptional regulator